MTWSVLVYKPRFCPHRHNDSGVCSAGCRCCPDPDSFPDGCPLEDLKIRIGSVPVRSLDLEKK